MTAAHVKNVICLMMCQQNLAVEKIFISAVVCYLSDCFKTCELLMYKQKSLPVVFNVRKNMH